MRSKRCWSEERRKKSGSGELGAVRFFLFFYDIDEEGSNLERYVPSVARSGGSRRFLLKSRNLSPSPFPYQAGSINSSQIRRRKRRRRRKSGGKDAV